MANHQDSFEEIRTQWNVHDPTLQLEGVEFLARLAHVATKLQRCRNALLRQFDLEAWSYDMLSILRRQANPYLTPQQLMYYSGITSGTMTHRLDILEARGLITRQPSSTDGRSQLISLTPKGIDSIDGALQSHINHTAILLQDIPPENIDIAKHILKYLQELL
jgi:DNA-binding MarR family transcriptional regulator